MKGRKFSFPRREHACGPCLRATMHHILALPF